MPRELPLLIGLIVAAIGSATAAELPMERHPSHDGANCVALLSRLLKLSTAQCSTPVKTLADTAAELRKRGGQAAVYRMQTDHPGRIPVPSIIYCEADDPGLGRLAVFLGVSDSGACIVFDGATAIVEAHAEDDFMRSFTGRGVMVQPASTTSALAYGLRMLAALAVCGCLIKFRKVYLRHRQVGLNSR